MQISISKGELNIESVRKLIASKDDSIPRQIRVSQEGIVYISDDTGPDSLDGVLFRFESLQPGKDYLGVDAANDDEWLSEYSGLFKTTGLHRRLLISMI